jgi:hypothetical protein
MTVVYEQRFAEDNVIEYSGITSCMTVTCRLPNNVFMGVHFSAMYSQHMAGILRQMSIRINGRQVQSMYVAGAFLYWGAVPAVQFQTQNAIQTFSAALNPNDAPCFMRDLDGVGERPNFSILMGNVRVVDARTGLNITDTFNEL